MSEYDEAAFEAELMSQAQALHSISPESSLADCITAVGDRMAANNYAPPTPAAPVAPVAPAEPAAPALPPGVSVSPSGTYQRVSGAAQDTQPPTTAPNVSVGPGGTYQRVAGSGADTNAPPAAAAPRVRHNGPAKPGMTPMMAKPGDVT